MEFPTICPREARFTESDWFIIEGDEYDTAFFDKRSKFVHYLPDLVILNNLEFDHADIFENVGAIQLAFKRLINIVPRNGLVLANGIILAARAAARGETLSGKGFRSRCELRHPGDRSGTSG